MPYAFGRIHMSEPLWKKLVDDLQAKGHQSPYLDRLRQRFRSVRQQHDLAREILQEMASALGRAEDKVNVALLELELHGQAIDALGAGRAAGQPKPEMQARIAAFNRQREVPARALWELRVHREAMGFLRNDDLATHYPIPPKR